MTKTIKTQTLLQISKKKKVNRLFLDHDWKERSRAGDFNYVCTGELQMNLS